MATAAAATNRTRFISRQFSTCSCSWLSSGPGRSDDCSSSISSPIVKKVVRWAELLKGHPHGFRFQACSRVARVCGLFEKDDTHFGHVRALGWRRVSSCDFPCKRGKHRSGNQPLSRTVFGTFVSVFQAERQCYGYVWSRRQREWRDERL